MNTQGYNQEGIQNLNRTLLLKLLREEGECSRGHLSELSKLKPATVTNIVNDFIDWGLIVETGFLTGNKGRRSIGISINNVDFGVIGIRIARKNYAVGVFDLSGNLVEEKRALLSANQHPRDEMDQILRDTKDLISSSSPRKILSIGVAIPGPFNRQKDRIELMTGTSGWANIPVREVLKEAFHLPVFLEQDANAGALAQYWHNNMGNKSKLLVYVAAGQGIGAGIINDGKLIRGDIGTAGEIGHTSICFDGPRCACGNYGCLELYCSSIAFEREANRLLGSDYTIEEIAEILRKGNEKIRELYLDMCDKLSIGIINIINNFNPSVIVIGDEMAHIAPDLMLERVRQRVRERVLPDIAENTEIIMSVVKKDSIMHGAAIVAIEDIFAQPQCYFGEL